MRIYRKYRSNLSPTSWFNNLYFDKEKPYKAPYGPMKKVIDSNYLGSLHIDSKKRISTKERRKFFRNMVAYEAKIKRMRRIGKWMF